MKPVAFDYQRPRDLDAALNLIAAGDRVKLLAGGQSLGPMLNMRLVQPDLIVDIAGLPELRRVEQSKEGILIGACVTHADIEDERVPDVTRGALRAIAAGIAYRAVRNRGTIGGSLSHADPSADWVSALAVLAAHVTLRGRNGERKLPVEDFVTGALETALAPGEMLEAIRIPALSAQARWGFVKVCRKTGEYAHAIGAVLVDPDRGFCRAVIGATETKPIVFVDASGLFGGRFDRECLAHYDPRAVEPLMERAGLDDPIDRQIHAVALTRAVRQAFAS